MVPAEEELYQYFCHGKIPSALVTLLPWKWCDFTTDIIGDMLTSGQCTVAKTKQ